MDFKADAPFGGEGNAGVGKFADDVGCVEFRVDRFVAGKIEFGEIAERGQESSGGEGFVMNAGERSLNFTAVFEFALEQTGESGHHADRLLKFGDHIVEQDGFETVGVFRVAPGEQLAFMTFFQSQSHAGKFVAQMVEYA